MKQVTSRDGTIITYDQAGDGPPVILVCGGSVDRMSNAPLAAILSIASGISNAPGTRTIVRLVSAPP